MYAPHELERTPKALELVGALRDADAVVVGSPGYHGAVSGLVKNALDYIEDLREDPRVYLDNTPWGCISCAYGWQAAVGTLGQLRSIGHALRAWPTPLGVAINSADEIWDSEGRRRRRRCAEPTRHAGHPGACLRPRRLGNGVTEARNGRRFWSTGSPPAISKRAKAIRSSCCTAGSSASARTWAGSTTSPHWPGTTGCWRSTCWASGSRPR